MGNPLQDASDLFTGLPSLLVRNNVQVRESEAIEGETHWLTSPQMRRNASDLEDLGLNQHESSLRNDVGAFDADGRMIGIVFETANRIELQFWQP